MCRFDRVIHLQKGSSTPAEIPEKTIQEKRELHQQEALRKRFLNSLVDGGIDSEKALTITNHLEEKYGSQILKSFVKATIDHSNESFPTLTIDFNGTSSH